MFARREYFDDLLTDAIDAVDARWGSGSGESRASLVAALIQSDSLNGLRKALLQQGPRGPSSTDVGRGQA